MRESPKASQAFSDYVALGDARSLQKLVERYQSASDSSPTRRLMTLARWSVAHGWQARLVAIAKQERASIIARGIAERQNRVDALNDRWDRMRRVIAERADAPETQEVAGGKTGLIVHNVKGVGKGADFQLVDVYEVDTGLLAEMRATEKQAAQELGQWVEKGELTGKNGGPLDVRVEDARSELTARLATIAGRRRESAADSRPEAGIRDEAAI